MEKRVLVTGGAGFIGSHIVEDLVKEGAYVAVVDNFSTGKRENLANVSGKIEIFEADITDGETIIRLFQEWKPQVVSHQAAQASVKVSMEEPQRDAWINIVGGINVLRASVEVGVDHFVFASTGGAIYGEVPEGDKALESWPPLPKSPYAVAKASFELYLRAFNANFGLPFTVLRYANVFGPRQDPFGEAGVVAIFTERLLEGKPLVLYARKIKGDTGCVRDYVYVEDVAKIHTTIVQKKVQTIMNVSSAIGRTTMEILEAVASSLKAPPHIIYSDPRPGDLEVSVLDNTAASGLIKKWTSFEEGIARTTEWFAKARKRK